ncbi:MAG: ester cyclase [Planctomycetaceae bacterium]|nr:MAG: ester cyclase [Planctomycetaceae bacterium]
MAKRKTQESTPMSVQEQNKEIVRRFYAEVMGKGDTAALDELMHPDFSDHGESLFGSPQGRDTLKGGIGYMHDLFEDFSVYIEDMIADGDLVGVRGTMRCKNTGAWLGVQPMGNNLEWKGLAIFRIEDGKIKERWFNSDSLNVAIQMGAVKI